MNANPNKTIVLAAVLGVLGFAGVGYVLVLGPIAAKNKAIAAAQTAVEEAEQKQLLILKKKKEIGYDIAAKRSIPADLAKPDELLRMGSEYDSLLREMLNRHFQASNYSSTADKQPESSNWTTAPNKPIYKRLKYAIDVPSTDLLKLKNFLKEFYKVGLLHRIDSLDLERGDDSAKRELKVKMTVSIIALDFGEKRPTLFPIALLQGYPAGAFGGAAAWYAVSKRAVENRRASPFDGLVKALAFSDDEYDRLLGRDPFYGPLPQPKPKIVKEEPKVVEPPPPPPPDLRPFLRLTSITRNDTTVEASLMDDYNGYYYTIVQENGGTIRVTAEYDLNGRKKTFPREFRTLKQLHIMYGLDLWVARYDFVGIGERDLILAQAPDKKTSAALAAALVTLGRGEGLHGIAESGAVLATRRKLYAWHIGDKWSNLREITATEAQSLLGKGSASAPMKSPADER